jgi:RHS repeat-associated protein
VPDPARNRTADRTDEAAMGAAFDNVNELESRQPGGVLAFKGMMNEPDSVTVAGKAAQTASGDSFNASAPVGTGTTNVSVVATDPAGNVRTNTYRVSIAGATTNYTYDPNGNLTTKTEGSNTWTYSWNAENQLTKVEKNGAEVARFAYDPLGRRIEEVATGVATAWTYDDDEILRETPGTSVVKYIHGPGTDEPLAADDGTVLTYLHPDGLASIVKTTNAGGAVTLIREYGAWGEALLGAGEPGYAFTGREWDPATGLYYYRARYYDPILGRFLAEDPIAFDGGDVNLYAYVRENPATMVDPAGLQAATPPFILCEGEKFKGYGHICCVNGTIVPCVPPPGNPCTIVHEQEHVNQCPASKRPKGQQCDGAYCVPWACGTDECVPSQKQYECLQGAGASQATCDRVRDRAEQSGCDTTQDPWKMKPAPPRPPAPKPPTPKTPKRGGR